MIKKIKKTIKNPRRILLYLIAKLRCQWLPDDIYLKLVYWAEIGKTLNLENPQTFNEKIQWLKIHDRKAEYTRLVDKYEVKKYIADSIGEEYVIPTLGVWDCFDDIDFRKLPDRFVLKCTHDSGGIVIVKDKKNFDLEAARKKLEKALMSNYYYLRREWPYKNVKPRILAETYMEEEGSSELSDYKFMCFNGKVKCSFTCTERYSDSGLKVTFYDKEWNIMPFERHYPKCETPLIKPCNYDKMIELAEKLSKDLIFARIDFYEINGKVYFGEITFYPGSGMEEFEPEEWDEKLGSWIDLKIK